MGYMDNICDRCVTDKSLCEKCNMNPKYRDYPRRSFFSEYKPLCPQGFSDCVFDPAYIYCYHRDWYKKLYVDRSPEEVVKTECDIYGSCYDDEDK